MKLTPKQEEAQKILASDAKHIMLLGGSRSGKTFLLVRAVCMRAIKAPNSRHAILRFRFNACKAAIVLDTFPKVMQLAFPGVKYTLDKTDWYASFENGSQIWFGGLDDKERTEKILGMEFVTMYLNEVSQIPYASRNIAVTRLAQSVDQIIGKDVRRLKPRMYYDCNPPSKAHWIYRLFIEKRDVDTKLPLRDPEEYATFVINPHDNAENISDDYLETLEHLPERLRKRFLAGEFADATPNALFHDEDIDKWRVRDGSALPDMVRIVIGVDPSGAGDDDSSEHDAVGIVVGGLGTDGNAYLLEDATVSAGPKTWGGIVGTAYDRHRADVVVGEVNYGGAMVGHVVQTARPRTHYKTVNASRGKHIRAEPFSPLYEQGRIRHVGYYNDLEDELAGFSTHGYTGTQSPNRADAWFWVLTELFHGIVSPKDEKPIDTTPLPIVTKWRKM